MDIRTTAFAAALLGFGLAAAPAQAQEQGLLTCQITLSQFAEDVTASKARLNSSQLKRAHDILDIGRSQCRSGPQLVMTDIRSARTAMNLASSGRPSYRFSDFWPAPRDELASLSR